MKRILMLCTIITICIATSFGQDIKEPRVKLILKGGTTLFGNLVNYHPEESVELRLDNGKVITYRTKQVKKVIMASKNEKFLLAEKPYNFIHKKYVHNTRLGISPGVSGTGAGASYSLLRQIRPNVLVGMGVGIENIYGQRGFNVYPIFAEGKYYILESNASPFVSLRTGVTFGFPDASIGIIRMKPGFMINPVFGYRFGGNNLMFEFFTGVKVQQADYERYINNGTSQLDILARRLDLGFAMTF